MNTEVKLEIIEDRKRSFYTFNGSLLHSDKEHDFYICNLYACSGEGYVLHLQTFEDKYVIITKTQSGMQSLLKDLEREIPLFDASPFFQYL